MYTNRNNSQISFSIIGQHTSLKHCALLYTVIHYFRFILKTQPWHSKCHYTYCLVSIEHLNIYINMRLILNIYITYNVKYPQYIYNVSK